jgi:hypothetical protein
MIRITNPQNRSPVYLSLESTSNSRYSRCLLSCSPSNSRLRRRGMDMSNVPILVPVQESREDSVQVCAGADEEQDYEEEGLELEDSELC